MSFKVYFSKISKRENSTKHDSISDMRGFDCVILRGSGILNPKIELHLGVGTDPSQYNHAYIPAFQQRFYWVREWIFDNNLWTAYLEVDALATYKAKIGAANPYILRAENAYNGNIADTLYPVKTGCSYTHTSKSDPWSGPDTGCYVLGIVSQDGQFGSITYYAMGRNSLATFLSKLMSTAITQANGFSWDDASQALQKAIIDPIQYIRSAVFIPRPLSDITGTSVSTINIFDWNISGVSAKIPNVTEIAVEDVWTIKKHPDTNSRGNYVNAAPYTIMTLQIAPFGVIEVDTSVTCNSSELATLIHLDIFTGRAVLEVICNNEILNSIESQVGVPIQISQVARNFLGAATSALGAIGSGVTGNFIGALSGIGNAFTSLVPRSNTIGSQGSFTALESYYPMRLSLQFFRPVDDDPTHNGRPLCERRHPSDLGGYMLCQDGDVALDGGTKEECRIVREYLESGFYYE